MTNPTLGTVGQADLINATGLPISTGVAGLGTGIATFLATPTSANLRASVTDETGTGSLVFATSPTLVAPNLGTPTAMIATNITGTALGLIAGSAVTNANLTGAVTSVGNATSLGSFTSAQLLTALTDETGSGANVFATSPVLVTPALGTPSSGVLTNATGLPLTTGVTGTLGLANGGTGQITANAAFNALAPSQTGNSGKYLTTDGSNTSWGTNPLGTVTSVDVSGGTTGLTTSGGPITTSGTITLSGTLAVANGGTGVTTSTGTGSVVLSTSPTLVTPALGTPSALVGTNITGTAANFNINGTVGATTANTGAFTTLAASSTVTLSGGTANGVTYLNGSKVLTSGSALTFDGTNLSSTGGATFLGSPSGFGGGEVRLGPTTADTQSAISTQSTGSPQLIFDHRGTSNTGSYIWRNGSGGANELMRLTSTGLGIGTSSPAYKLDVNTTANSFFTGIQVRNLSAGSSATSSYALGQDTNAAAAAIFINSSTNTSFGGANSLNIYNGLNAPMAFYTNATKQATLDAAGNLGLGVTPSAWTSYKALQLSGSAYLYGFGNDELGLGQGAYYSSGWKYAATGVPATWYNTYRGTYNWNIAASGTAGNAISFTQAMTLDASGNLLVGTTSASCGSVDMKTHISATDFCLGITTAASSTTQAVRFAYGATAVGSITLTGTTTSYNVVSDQRLKENIIDAPEFGSVIDSLKVRSYDWKANGSHQRAGFVAQELVTVAPEAVHQPEDTEQMMAVDYSKLVPMLVKEIQSLRQRLSAANL